MAEDAGDDSRTLSALVVEIRKLPTRIKSGELSDIDATSLAGRFLEEAIGAGLFEGVEWVELREIIDLAKSDKLANQLSRPPSMVSPPPTWHAFVNAVVYLMRRNGKEPPKFDLAFVEYGCGVVGELMQDKADALFFEVCRIEDRPVLERQERLASARRVDPFAIVDIAKRVASYLDSQPTQQQHESHRRRYEIALACLTDQLGNNDWVISKTGNPLTSTYLQELWWKVDAVLKDPEPGSWHASSIFRGCELILQAEADDSNNEPPTTGVAVTSIGNAGPQQTADDDNDSPNKYDIIEKLDKRVRLAYYSFQYAEAKKGRRLQDTVAWEYLDEYGIEDTEAARELRDYDLPAFDTWSRYLREARNALSEQKYTPRTRRN